MNRQDRDTAKQRAQPNAPHPSDTPTQQTPRVHYAPAHPQQRPPQGPQYQPYPQAPQQRPQQAPHYPHYPQYPQYPQQRPNGYDRPMQGTVGMPRVQNTAAGPAPKRATPRMPKQQAMQVVGRLKKFIIAGSVMAFGVVTALAATHSTGVTASAASATGTSGTSSATATPTSSSNSDDGGFFNQPSSNSNSSNGSSVSSSGTSQQPVSGSSVS